ncbi:hypothetical protein [Desulfitobacterium sp.]|uniref:hypothetical protein n=1 Tax=Desulfitobacterium sp. TaxID=49981 RepID=UPI002D0CA1D7|nr:hypothetical protein [Desulfitobacterium sp.]HVJ49612.1 hypothetical protein [Desulfitobacterium sp.]
MIMIAQKEQKNQLPNEIQPAFKEFKVLHLLRNSGFKKNFNFLDVNGMAKPTNQRYLDTTIVYARYILLARHHRQDTDDRTLGGLFSVLCRGPGVERVWTVRLFFHLQSQAGHETDLRRLGTLAPSISRKLR